MHYEVKLGKQFTKAVGIVVEYEDKSLLHLSTYEMSLDSLQVYKQIMEQAPNPHKIELEWAQKCGQLAEHKSYDQFGRPHGLWMQAKGGMLTKQTQYNHGEQNGPYYAVGRDNDGHKKRSAGNFKNGKRDGAWTFLFRWGKISGFYANGLKEGIWSIHTRDNTLAELKEYIADEFAMNFNSIAEIKDYKKHIFRIGNIAKKEGIDRIPLPKNAPRPNP
ncbi:MAG: hypothetical protein KDJ35_06890 [Alphaproteobacteria bacterium]|nr:hypothetical protein [Alphaproteobacteria bacterium]